MTSTSDDDDDDEEEDDSDLDGETMMSHLISSIMTSTSDSEEEDNNSDGETMISHCLQMRRGRRVYSDRTAAEQKKEQDIVTSTSDVGEEDNLDLNDTKGFPRSILKKKTTVISTARL